MSAIIQFAVVFFLAGCAIALAGDRLGTMVGKRRISRFGLRPRHTAILYTTCSGGLIAIATVLFLFNYDQRVHFALVYGRQLTADIARQKRTIGENEVQLAQDRVQLATARSQTSVAEQQLALSQSALKLQKAELASTRDALAKGQADLKQAHVKLAQTNAALTETLAHLAQTATTLGHTTASLTSTQTQLKTTGLRLAAAQNAYVSEQGQVAALRVEQQRLSDRNKQLVGQNADLVAQNTALSTEGMIFRNGQEIDRVVVPTGLSIAATEAKLQSWLSSLEHQAEHLGVGMGAGGTHVLLEAGVASNDIAGPDLGGKPLSRVEILSALAHSISSQVGIVGSVVVVAKSKANVVEGQPARVALYPFDNVLVFNKGARIASVTIDGRRTTQQIYADLRRFLMGSVRPVAKSAGLMPSIDHSTGQVSYGGIQDGLAAVNRIQAIGSDAVVTAVAQTDTYTATELKLDLLVAPSDRSADHHSGPNTALANVGSSAP